MKIRKVKSWGCYTGGKAGLIFEDVYAKVFKDTHSIFFVFVDELSKRLTDAKVESSVIRSKDTRHTITNTTAMLKRKKVFDHKGISIKRKDVKITIYSDQTSLELKNHQSLKSLHKLVGELNQINKSIVFES